MVVAVPFCLNIIEIKYNFEGMQFINYYVFLFVSRFKDRGELLLILCYYCFMEHL
jgi:hypothetical protein